MYKIQFIYACCFLIFINIVHCMSTARKCNTKCCENHPAVKSLQEYIKIDTSIEQNLGQSVEFWKRQAADAGLPISVYYPDGLPICVITWLGTNTSLPSIALNNHADVVPVEKKFWTYPPFAAHIDKNCNIFGRGTQDTKALTLQELEAVKRLIQKKVRLERTVHITIMPDEEIGGYRGIKPFIKTKEFRDLNIGFALDEGLTNADDIIQVSYQDRRPWQMRFTMFGAAGHGSGMPSNSAMQKMYRLLKAVNQFREEQNKIREQLDPLDYGGYTSININKIVGGLWLTPNVIPSEVSVVIDMRLSVNADIPTTQAMVESWRLEAGNDTLLEFIRRDEISSATSLDCNPYWDAMVRTAKHIGIKMKPIVIGATTDVLVLRNIGIPALGFAPRINTPPLFHANDEFLNIDMFLYGIDVFEALVKSLGNVPDFSKSN